MWNFIINELSAKYFSKILSKFVLANNLLFWGIWGILLPMTASEWYDCKEKRKISEIKQTDFS